MRRPGLLADSDILKPTIDHFFSRGAPRLFKTEAPNRSNEVKEAPSEEEPPMIMLVAGVALALGIFYLSSLGR